WSFGDGAVGSGATATHTYTTAQSFTVTETATDSSSPSQTATSSKTVTVTAPPPLSTSFTFLPATPVVNSPVTFIATTIGETSPYTYSIAFGDCATGAGSITTHAYSIAGFYTAKVTVTDSASPKASITASKIVNVQALIPPTLTIPGNQTITATTWINFTITAASANIGGAVSLSATGLPADASFNQATGLFSWKP